MRQASKRIPESAEKTVRDIRRATRRHHSAEEKIRIVLEGLRGEDSIAELCRKEGINQNLYYRWSKEFLEAGKKRLAGDTAREATSDEVKELKAVRREDDVRNLVDRTMARFGRIDAAVNAAGTEGQPGLVTDQTAESFAATFDTNVLGTLLSMKHELRAMQAQTHGSIVNISSP